MNKAADLTGKVSLVIGGGGHIGKVICETLAELGSKVAVHDLSKEKTEKVRKAIEKKYQSEAIAVEADLLDEKETRSVIPYVANKFKRLDILVHCAAFVGTTSFPGWAVPFQEQTVEAFEKCLKVNLTSAFILCQEAQKHLEKRKSGSIILISSIYGVIAPDFALYEGTKMANPAGYGASKGGLIQLTRYLATLFAPEIRVNSISLGGVFRNQDPKFVEKYKKKTPLGRMAKEEDIKGTIAYLASDMSKYLTGQNIVLDGGFTIW
jgi:NAD(P)-dependent dehydrogenase (short-subunit alcohol dehydrogenase family)